MKKDLILVGIGASAGGLEALNDFFDHINPKTGMAFVVVQHLSPDFKSLMEELLGKHTEMTIKVVREDTPVQPNYVYLISKESNIIIKDGLIKPVQRQNRHVLNLPIDEFFHSLGTEQRENSIGIILSGTGTDGSRGIATIKEVGGMVLVQEPETAQFDGMPKAAINTGLVDEVLSSFMIAKTLNNLTRSTAEGLLFLNPDDNAVSRHFYNILALVGEQVGVDFTGYRKSTLYRRIEKRMFLTGHKKIQKYAQDIEDDRTEIIKLYNEFLIGVTRFFRDKEAFEILNDKIISEIIEGGTYPIRIWVAGCSTGEEAYSLAMLFQDYIDKSKIRRTFKIFASDLDAHAIDIASKGSFGREYTNNIPAEFLQKFFQINMVGEFVIKKVIREKIVFTVHDALNDPPFINLDLISCRNFLIYLKPETQHKLLVSFQFSLKHGGHLFLGPSESLGDAKSAFRTINQRWNIYKNISKTNLKPAKFYQQPLIERKRRDSSSSSKQMAYEEIKVQANESIFTNWLLYHYVPLLIFVNEDLDVLYIHGDAERLLTFPRGPGSFNLKRMLDGDELLIFKNGIRKTSENRKINLYKDIPFEKKGNIFKLELSFEPARLKQLQDSVYLVCIKIIEEGDKVIEEKAIERDAITVDKDAYQKEQLRTLNLELQKIKSEKLALVEELETTNEELQSSNEELIASNEELQSTNEELQSVNEELYTVNAELQNKVSELTLAHNDMDNLMKSTGIGTIFVDKSLNVRKFTPAIQKQFNLVKTDIGRPITSFVNTFENIKIYDDFKMVLKNNQKIEKEVTDDNGNLFLMSLLPYQLEDQQKNGVVATFVDITEIETARERTKSLAEKYEILFKYSEDYITSLDSNLKILNVNKFPNGYTKEELVGQDITKFLSLEAKGQFVKSIKKSNRLNNPIKFVMSTTLKNGELRWFDNTLVPLKSLIDDDQYLFISKDITYEKVTERELLRKATMFNEIFKHIKIHILILDENGLIKDINYTSAGFKREDVVGKKISEILPNEKSTKGVKQAIKAIQGGLDFYQFRLDFLSLDGLVHHYEDTFFPITLDDKLEEIVMLVRDRTDEVKAENFQKEKEAAVEKEMNARSKELREINLELAEANSYLDSFVHGAAHDLRSPLTQMQGYLNLLPEIEDRADQQAAFTELRDASYRMERILNGLVELISFKKNVSPIVKEINLLNLCEEVLEDLKPYLLKAEANNVNINIPKDLNIYYIEAFLNSVLYNLLHNAVKYRSYERTLTIKVEAKKEKGFIVIQISDNGIGMDLQRYGHFLFQPFKRLTVERPGSGIGLSIINNSVRRNGGRIEVDSYLDKGTTFTVYLKAYELE